ncbi:hypothetical protein COCSUDRAFT_45262 [Coccomyxa subellipsoidea C-169]|uniref:N-acetyltransferase domain-containing protein n=1 Tax=Coccomyxa subellipsoidea (strain C-169) TaxID=574566 RepID=I0YJ89_COCSC|nr:hypothetical protein COCSUDRAFT_45262 [Coccomyxa subellipsoidea C-169]EIE18458.1 hypothetical protein COCSUDRAFT_45262 [Coccomyxa subellipsoidea C-169]|eukprot:XP_005643002.1 hypothetical protein COCSUDRAFT_45262 [Coccomyxa subellipsoidea C-169]
MANDPIACYLVKGSSIGRFWDVMITQYLTPTQSELNFITEGAKAAVLARVYPDEKASAFQSFLFTLRMVPCFSTKRLRAALRMGDKMDSTKDAFGKEHGSYIYVFLLGARPEWQGRGLGSALLQHLNSIADAKGMHCYLESSSERSRRLYMRHGYVEIETIKAARDAPPMFLMSRTPSNLLTGTNGNGVL